MTEHAQYNISDMTESDKHICCWCGKEIYDSEVKAEDSFDGHIRQWQRTGNRATVYAFIKTEGTQYGEKIYNVAKQEICYECFNAFMEKCRTAQKEIAQ